MADFSSSSTHTNASQTSTVYSFCINDYEIRATTLTGFDLEKLNEGTFFLYKMSLIIDRNRTGEAEDYSSKLCDR